MVGRLDEWIQGRTDKRTVGRFNQFSAYIAVFRPRKSGGSIAPAAFAVYTACLRIPRSAVPRRLGRARFRPLLEELLRAPQAAGSPLSGPLVSNVWINIIHSFD